MDKHRENTGIEGSWLAYFKLLKHAIESKNFRFKDKELKIQYPLIAGARITGRMEMDEVKSSRERQEMIKSMLFKVGRLLMDKGNKIEDK